VGLHSAVPGLLVPQIPDISTLRITLYCGHLYSAYVPRGQHVAVCWAFNYRTGRFSRKSGICRICTQVRLTVKRQKTCVTKS